MEAARKLRRFYGLVQGRPEPAAAPGAGQQGGPTGSECRAGPVDAASERAQASHSDHRRVEFARRQPGESAAGAAADARRAPVGEGRRRRGSRVVTLASGAHNANKVVCVSAWLPFLRRSGRWRKLSILEQWGPSGRCAGGGAMGHISRAPCDAAPQQRGRLLPGDASRDGLARGGRREWWLSCPSGLAARGPHGENKATRKARKTRT